MIYLILIPILAGFLCLIIPKIKELTAILVSLFVFIFSVILFFHRPENSNLFVLDSLSGFILLAVSLFGFLIILYSLKFMAGKNRLREYYTYILWALGASCGTVFANNFLLLLALWGFIGLTLYLLIGIGGPDASDAAKKTIIIVGSTDALMILGIAIIWVLTGSFKLNNISLQLTSFLPILAFLMIAIASFAKAGAMPFHTWIPDSAETAPLPVVAFMPASLDKLLGIYLLARISKDIFVINPNSAISFLLLIIGAVTIVAAVMMALVQHNAKKLLSYHAVSQVGYMVLGIGTGTAIGIAGGLFHMLNHAIYKSCLFLSVGNVEHKTNTTDLDKLGGLAKSMPITFIAFLLAAFSISGIPPLNGFASKWMVYQSILELGKLGSHLWPIWLIAAMFGSALTLASFMKLIHAIFLGQSAEDRGQKTEHGRQRTEKTSWNMLAPVVVLAGLCVLFGIFAYQLPLKYFISPAVKSFNYTEIGFFSPGLVTILILTGIILGLVIYWIGNIKNVRVDNSTFIGGEKLLESERVTGTEFYNTISDLGIIKYFYNKSEEKIFDIYDDSKRLTFFFTRFFARLHNGVLSTYLSWCLLGMVLLFFFLLKGR